MAAINTTSEERMSGVLQEEFKNAQTVEESLVASKKLFEKYISGQVLPSLRGKSNEILLQELQIRWAQYKILVNSVGRFLDKKIFNPSLQILASGIFKNLVIGEMNAQIHCAINSLYNQERQGKKDDQDLVKNALAMYEEIAMEMKEQTVKENMTVSKRSLEGAIHDDGKNKKKNYMYWKAAINMARKVPKVDDIPIKLQNWIVEMGTKDVNCLRQMFLSPYDLVNGISIENLKDGVEFLEVLVVDQDLIQYSLPMVKRLIKTPTSYYLQLRNVCETNGIDVGDLVQLWFFQLQSRNCFAFFKVDVPNLGNSY